MKLDTLPCFSWRQVEFLPNYNHRNLFPFHCLCSPRHIDKCLHPPQEKGSSNFYFIYFYFYCYLAFLASYIFLVKTQLTLMPPLMGHHLPCLFPSPCTCRPHDYAIAVPWPKEGHLWFHWKWRVSALPILGFSNHCSVEHCLSFLQTWDFAVWFYRISMNSLWISMLSCLKANSLFISFCLWLSISSRASLPQMRDHILAISEAHSAPVHRKLGSPILPQELCLGQGLWCAVISTQCQKSHPHKIQGHFAFL